MIIKEKRMRYLLIIIILPSIVIATPVFSQEEGFLKIDDGVIHYKTFGHGSPLLIINGGPGLDCEGFSSLAVLLSDKYQTILFDQRGTGKSVLRQTDSTTITMARMAADMESLRKQLKFKEWIVLGHSFGGWLAEYYASYYPNSIKGIILSGSGGIDMEILDYFNANINIRLSETQKEAVKYWQEKIKQGDTGYRAKYKRSEALASAYLYNRALVPELAERLTHGNARITELVYNDLYTIKFDCKETLQNFLRPVLIIQGRQDVVGSETAYKAHLILKNSTLVFLNECGHYGWLDQKERYKAEIDKFISVIDKMKTKT
jgi:proline iminopeptidase